MRVVFIQDNGLNESLIITELSSYLRAHGHITSLLIEREVRSLERAAAEANPDLFVLQASILAHEWVLRTARALHATFPAVPRLVIGSHPTLFPDIIERDGIDMIVVGEPEVATGVVLDALAGKRPLHNIANLHVRRGRTIHRNEIRALWPDLDELPLPDRDLYFDRYPFMADFGWKKFMTGRGCIHDCTYCYQPRYRSMCRGKGTYVRRKSPERVCQEVAAVARRYPLTNAHFSDDLFVTNQRWLEEFAEIFPDRVGTPYSLNSAANYVTDQSAEPLRRSGCRSVAIGVESGDEQQRKKVLGKSLSNAQIERAARAIKGQGLTLVTFNMIAGPRETVDQAMGTLKFNIALGTDYARVAIFRPIPSTALAVEAQAKGELIGAGDGSVYSITYGAGERPRVFLRSAKPDEHRFVNLYHLFNLGVRHPRLVPLIERLIDLPTNRLFELASVQRMLLERDTFALSLSEGVRYFAHTGPPEHRTANFVSLP